MISAEVTCECNYFIKESVASQSITHNTSGADWKLIIFLKSSGEKNTLSELHFTLLDSAVVCI